MTTTPPLPDEPENARDDAQQALDDLSAKPGQDKQGGRPDSSSAPPPIPPVPPMPPVPPSQPQPQPQPGQPGQPDSPGFGQPINQPPGQPNGQQYGQSATQPSGQQYGDPAAASQFGQASGQPGGPQFGQPVGQPVGQTSGPQVGQSSGQPPYGQATGQGSPGGDSPYGRYPSAPPPPGPSGSGYGEPTPGVAGMPPYAGWWQRVGASLLDNYLVGLALELIVSWSGSSALRTIGGLIALAWALYNAYLAGKTGQSYGKRAIGIRLARMEDGLPVGGGYGLLRWLMNTVFWLLCVIPGVLNYLWPLWDAKHQTWSDKIANSVVVRAE